MREYPRNVASLRVASQITTAEEIADALDFEPDHFLIKGSKAVPDAPNSYIHKAHLWSISSDLDEKEPIEAQIARLLEFIEHREAAFQKLTKTCEFDIFCGCFSNQMNGYLALSSDLLKRLSIIPIKLIVNFYPPLSDES